MQSDTAAIVQWFGELSDLTVLGILLSSAGVALLLYLWQGRRSRDELLVASLQGTLAAQQSKIDAQASSLSLLGERVLALEEYLELVSSRQQQMDSDKRDARFYQQAIRLADQGLPADELVQRCGISRSEAELITAMRSSR
ncbi:DUF2802 domain-containing protein [Spongiibacter sp.]|uniref:DUF2802 domain-containing protein n=1 Tax=Spongiibacter sp. TaxID=2024860 RepID=UPI00356569E7